MHLGNIIVTGGLGFIGSHFIREVLSDERYGVNLLINIDFGGYGSNPHSLKDMDTRYRNVNADINDTKTLESLAKTNRIEMIVNFAAETHVDRSISDPSPFLRSNVNGVASLLEVCRKQDIRRYIQISTDEVYGNATGRSGWKEDSPLLPNNPYSASKAAADLLVRSYNRTYGLDAMITRCCNNFGPNQFPEKLIPKIIIRSLKGLPIPIYGDGMQRREWIYVRDHVQGVLAVAEKGKKGEIYNVSTSSEITNNDLIARISKILEESGIKVAVEHVKDRPGHDRRYSLNSRKIRKETGWKPAHVFEHALRKTIDWYRGNESWWKPLITKEVLHPQPWKLNWVK